MVALQRFILTLALLLARHLLEHGAADVPNAQGSRLMRRTFTPRNRAAVVAHVETALPLRLIGANDCLVQLSMCKP